MTHDEGCKLRALERLRGSQGTRSGINLAIATAAWTGGAALFSLVCIRFLGSERFGDVATMSALGTLLGIPLGSVQSLLAREIAQLESHGDRAGVGILFRRSVGIAALASLTLTVALIACSSWVGRVVNVDSYVVVAIGLSVVPFFAVGAILNGFLQGLQRFPRLSVVVSVSGLSRPILVLPVLLVGFGAGGALGVNTAASALAALLAAWFLRDLGARTRSRQSSYAFNRREMVALLGGTLAFASLTNLDVVLANAVLTDREGGLYAAASLTAKLILLFPLVVSTVLLPKATSRAAEGRSSLNMLRLSLAVTAGFSVVAAALLSLVSESVVVKVFGLDFKDSTALLGLFGVAMVLLGLVNVYLYYYLAYRQPGFPLLVGLAAIGQVVGVLLWHPGPRAVVIVTLICAGLTLLVHESLFPNGLVRGLLRIRRPADKVPLLDAERQRSMAQSNFPTHRAHI